MAFNIKSDETHALARELADRTGESMAKAVDEAIRAKLNEVKREDRVERIKALLADTARRFPPDWDSSTDDLYDEDGLPR
ncbi:MAG: type II toxin-antitoxin system VapB family antitoxin [Solirubrobacterales bacterium]